MIQGWYKNKILGDFAESICATHFDALGYHVEQTGVERFAQMLAKFSNQSTSQSVAAQTIMSTIHKTPDFLISRLFRNRLQSYMIEVKYRTKVSDMETFENELLWQYKDVIWKPSILEQAKFSQNEIASWYSNTQNLELIKKIKANSQKHKHINLPIIFYLVVKNPKENQTHVYCNLATFPKWWNAGDASFTTLKNGTYKSTNELNPYQDFNDVYFNEIEPALEQVFG
jgi:hypothetical protein